MTRTRILATAAGAIAAAGVTGIAVSAMLIDPWLADHVPKRPDAIHTIVWIAKKQLIGYATPAEDLYSRVALWLFLAMAFAGNATTALWQNATGDEAFEATDSRYWGYLIGATIMLPVMLTIYALLQH